MRKTTTLTSAINLKYLSPLKLIRFLTLYIIIFLAVCDINLLAQGSLAPSDSRFSIENSQGVVTVILQDTINVSEIEVSLSGKHNSIPEFNNSFQFDQTSGLATGLSYSRDGYEVNLGIGAITIFSVYKTKVRIKNSNGVWSAWFEYTSN